MTTKKALKIMDFRELGWLGGILTQTAIIVWFVASLNSAVEVLQSTVAKQAVQFATIIAKQNDNVERIAIQETRSISIHEALIRIEKKVDK